MLCNFKWPLALTVMAITGAFVIGGPSAAFLLIILSVLEVSLSFDNAIVNATVLIRMNEAWQRLFLTAGIVIAVFGMRLVFPLVIVGITANLSPSDAVRLAAAGGAANTPGTYANLLTAAHPTIAAFGGMFLGMLFLSFLFEERAIAWLSWLERPLARLGRLDQLGVVVALACLLLVARVLAVDATAVFTAGVLGIVVYLLVGGLGALFESTAHSEDAAGPVPRGRESGEGVGGRAGLFLFLYLEVLDASFSFDGVIGAFAITQNIFLIAAGLGVGAIYIRSMTVHLVRKGTLQEYIFLEHGAMWAIGALSVILLFSIRHEVPEVITAVVGTGIILAAFLTSLRHRAGKQRSDRVAGVA